MKNTLKNSWLPTWGKGLGTLRYFMGLTVIILGGFNLIAQAQMSPDVIDPGIILVGSRVKCSDQKLLSLMDDFLVIRGQSETVVSPEQVEDRFHQVVYRARWLGCTVIEAKESSTLRTFSSLRMTLPQSQKDIVLINQGAAFGR